MLLRCIEKECKQVNEVYMKASGEYKVFLEKAMKYLIRRPDLSSEILAEYLNIGRSTIFHRLKRLGLDYQLLKKAASYEHVLYKKIEEKGKYICLDEYSYKIMKICVNESLDTVFNLLNELEILAITHNLAKDFYEKISKKLKRVTTSLKELDRTLASLSIGGKQCIKSPLSD